MRRGLIVLGVVVIVAVGALLLLQQRNNTTPTEQNVVQNNASPTPDPLPQTFTSKHGKFSVKFPAEWEAAEVGPNIYWVTSPGTGVLPTEPLLEGGARISFALPAQLALLGTVYSTEGGETRTVDGQEAFVLRRKDGEFQTTTVVIPYSDGQLAAVLRVNPGDEAALEPLFFAIAETIQYSS
jgi:hypothetical protein